MFLMMLIAACGPSEEAFIQDYCDLAFECYPDSIDAFEDEAECVDSVTSTYTDGEAACDFDPNAARDCLAEHDTCPESSDIPACYGETVWGACD